MMNKNIIISLAILLLLSISIVSSLNASDIPSAGQALGSLKGNISSLKEGYDSFGGEFVEKINPYVMKISWFLLGTEFNLGWAFLLSLFFWLVLFYILFGVVGNVFSIKKVFALLVSFIITTLVMHALSDKTAPWISSIALGWLSALGAIITGLILAGAMWFLNKFFFKKSKTAEKMEKAEKLGKTIKASGEIQKKEMESYGENKKK